MNELPFSRAARHLRAWMIVSLFAALAAGSAQADEPDPKAQAQSLFFEARKALDAGDKATGCAKMRASLELFAVANTLFTVAQCEEDEGKIASAREHWERGLALIDAKDPRAPVAHKRVTALDGRVPRLRIVVPPGQAVPAVSLDGIALAVSALTDPIRVNPGRHVVIVRLAGREDHTREISLAENERTEFVATPGAPLPLASVVAPPAPSNTALARPPASAPALSPPRSARRTAGYMVGGVGLAGLVAAGVTGALVISANSDLDACQKEGACASAAISKYQTLLIANTVAFGVGIAGVGAGLVLILTAPKAKPAGGVGAKAFPFVLPGGGGLEMSGSF